MHVLELLFIKTQFHPEGKPIRLFMRQSLQVSLARHRAAAPPSVLSLRLIRLASLCHYLRVPVHHFTWWNALWNSQHMEHFTTDACSKDSGICLYLAGIRYWYYLMLAFTHAKQNTRQMHRLSHAYCTYTNVNCSLLLIQHVDACVPCGNSF